MKIRNILIAALALLFAPAKALAVCPVCTVAIAGGVGLSRWLKVDDTITGIWVGGFLIVFTFMTLNWLNAKKIHFWGRDFLISAIVYVASIYPLYYSDLIGHPQNSIWGLDKLVVGTIMGTFITLISVGIYPALKKMNNGRPYFPFQKVVTPVLFLAIASGVFYLITR